MADEENIRKWVEALRSGKYQQTTSRLSDGSAYSCLGVACEVAMENGVKLEKTLELEASPEQHVVYDGQGWELPSKVSYWLGLTFEDEYGDFLPVSDPPLWEEGARYGSCTEWNDDAKADFAKIADLIEQNYLTRPKKEGVA